MGLLDTAHDDMVEFVNDPDTGGEPISITSPDGVEEDFLALTNDIHFSIDPETGMTVAGRQCTAAVAIFDLEAVSFGGIEAVPDKTSRPWVVQATDVNGRVGTFKVSETHPDRSAGLMTLILEGYRI